MPSMKIFTTIQPGQIRQFGVPREGARLCFVWNVEGYRADVIFSTGKKDGIFTGWLEQYSTVISEWSANDKR